MMMTITTAKTLWIRGAVAAALAVSPIVAPPTYAQSPDRFWLRQGTILEGPGSRIGVTARDLEPAEAERLKVTGGVVVETVMPDSPAEKAGLRPEDVVVEFDGERVRSVRHFTRLVSDTPPERPVKAAALRDGRRNDITITPTARAVGDVAIDTGRLRDRIEELTARIPEFEVGIRDLTPRARLGVSVHELTRELAEYFGAKDGVLVASVEPDSPASRAALKAGDVITTVNGRSITSSSDLVRELRTVSGDGGITLGIVRDKKSSTVAAKIDVQPDRRARPERPLRRLRPIGTRA
jgi:serine protease Do